MWRSACPYNRWLLPTAQSLRFCRLDCPEEPSASSRISSPARISHTLASSSISKKTYTPSSSSTAVVSETSHALFRHHPQLTLRSVHYLYRERCDAAPGHFCSASAARRTISAHNGYTLEHVLYNIVSAYFTPFSAFQTPQSDFHCYKLSLGEADIARAPCISHVRETKLLRL